MLKSPKELEIAKSSLTARVENTEVGVCPICHAGMETVQVKDIDSFVCTKCRVALPTPNDTTLFSS